MYTQLLLTAQLRRIALEQVPQSISPPPCALHRPSAWRFEYRSEVTAAAVRNSQAMVQWRDVMLASVLTPTP